MDKKKFPYKSIGNMILILLSVFIGLFFILHEKLNINKPSIILSSTFLLALALIVLSKKFHISKYILVPILLVDGFFHLTSPLENLVENSPDWIIAFNFFGGNGMPVIVHQMMGVFLLITSAIFIYYLIAKRKDWYYYIYKYLIGLGTMAIISTSYIIKLLN
jgi:hypothetical protein